jgi:hypothetical protein
MTGGVTSERSGPTSSIEPSAASRTNGVPDAKIRLAQVVDGEHAQTAPGAVVAIAAVRRIVPSSRAAPGLRSRKRSSAASARLLATPENVLRPARDRHRRREAQRGAARAMTWRISAGLAPASSDRRVWECTAPSRRAPIARPSFTSSRVFASSGPASAHASPRASYAFATAGCCCRSRRKGWGRSGMGPPRLRPGSPPHRIVEDHAGAREVAERGVAHRRVHPECRVRVEPGAASRPPLPERSGFGQIESVIEESER